MRRTLTLCRAGLTATAALVLLTACGGSGDGDDAAASGSSRTTSSAAESSAPEADSAFCTQARALTTTLENAFNEDVSDPAALAQQFQQTADAIRKVDPPAEIADDWETLAGGLEQFAAAFARYDPTDPASASTFAQQSAQLQSQFTTSGVKVGTYLSEQCGIDTEVTESATPTS